MIDSRAQTIVGQLVEGYGLIDANLERCAAGLDECAFGERSTFRAIRTTDNIEAAIQFVGRHYTFPATLHVLIPLGQCTAIVNNSKNGSDFDSYEYHIARRLGARVARVVNATSRSWTNGVAQESLAYEARIFALHAANGNLIRNVCCMDDGGRWSFQVHGEPHVVETSFDYTARRKKDRFTTDNLRQLLGAYGLPALDAASFLAAGKYVLIREDYNNQKWQQDIDDRKCTFEQKNDPAHGYYERGLTWVAHMQTHAESVVADFERALKLNAKYEPLVRSYLDEARETLARTS
jgi:hypothetical protein